METITNSRYFPGDTDPRIKNLLNDYADAYEVTSKLAGEYPQIKIVKAAQKGFTVSNKSIAFRVLLDYRGWDGQIVVNFPNWRGWEKVIPLNAKNHFYATKRKDPYKESGHQHGYYHSFKFKSVEEFIDFFNKYMLYFPILIE
jgi:hypothetical protein